jgi:hypothetical protein
MATRPSEAAARGNTLLGHYREVRATAIQCPGILKQSSKPMEYVEQRDDGYYLSVTRVSLDSVAYGFLRGESPEGIVESFPALSLEQVHGALAFYLGNRAATDAYVEREEAEFARLREEARRKHPQLHAKLDAAKRESLSHRS